MTSGKDIAREITAWSGFWMVLAREGKRAGLGWDAL